MQVLVRDNNVDQVLEVLKKIQRESVSREVKSRGHPLCKKAAAHGSAADEGGSRCWKTRPPGAPRF